MPTPMRVRGTIRGKSGLFSNFRKEGVFLLPEMFACQDVLTKENQPAEVRRDPVGRKRTPSGAAGLMAMRRASAPIRGSGRPRAAHV